MCSTPFGIKDQISIPAPGTRPPYRCAQRLSASKIKSRCGGHIWRDRRMVLNAFRHQRSNLPHRHQSFFAVVFVLNAFRHQRSNLEAAWLQVRGVVECSTPFGIKDQISQRIFSRGGSYEVLNAFRHQRSNLLDGTYLRYTTAECSTPFGIKDQISGGSVKYAAGQTVCSTPFGIKDQISESAKI